MHKFSELITREFPVTNNLIHLNHAAVGPWPTRTADAVIRFAIENTQFGSLHFERWLETESKLRDMSAELVGAAHADDIALVKNTSEGLSMIASGFPFEPGDNVVISDQEFPSNRIVWESLENKGIEIRKVPLPCPGEIEEILITATDNRTRLLSISSVQYASGLRIDLNKLGALCRQKNIAFCVDAIQGLGVFPHNVVSANIDFLVADGHKWLLSPEGLAIFYCSPKWRNKIALSEFGWRMIEHPHDFTQPEWQPAKSARRFECGSPNMMGITALHESMTLFMEVGIDKVWECVSKRTEVLFDLIEKQPQLELITCSAEGRYAGITVFRHKELSDQQLYEKLNKNNVLCAMRGGGIRFSPHFYTPLDSLEQAIDIAIS